MLLDLCLHGYVSKPSQQLYTHNVPLSFSIFFYIFFILSLQVYMLHRIHVYTTAATAIVVHFVVVVVVVMAVVVVVIVIFGSRLVAVVVAVVVAGVLVVPVVVVLYSSSNLVQHTIQFNIHRLYNNQTHIIQAMIELYKQHEQVEYYLFHTTCTIIIFLNT